MEKIEQQLNESLTVGYATKPSLVAKRLGKTLKADQPQVLAESDHCTISYDPEQGIIVTLRQSTLKKGIEEVRTILAESKLPMVHEGSPLLTARTYCFTSGKEVALMESAGFKRNRESSQWQWLG
jgi:hypothetical protein